MTNEERAARAKKVLIGYTDHRAGIAEQLVIQNLIADLLHLANVEGFACDIDLILERAKFIYDDECTL